MPLCGAPGKAQSVVGTQLIVAAPWRRILATFLELLLHPVAHITVYIRDRNFAFFLLDKGHQKLI